MLPFRTFLFDLDGTLIDHFSAIHRTHAHVMKQLGLPPPTMAQVKRAVGLGLEHAVAILFGPDHAEKVTTAIPIYRAYWIETMLDDVVALPGALDILTAIKAAGGRTAVFTNKQSISAKQVCDKLGLTPLLDGVYGAFDTPWLKPEPKFAEFVITGLGAQAETTLMIGDSPFDVQAAQNAHFPCWCVTTGTHTAAELSEAGAARIFTKLSDVQAALGL